MLLSELAQKELIAIESGIRYGYLQDTECIFDEKTGKIIAFELPPKMAQRAHQKKQPKACAFILWEEIELLGEDRILFHKTSSSLPQ